jgi:hypothetical protein
MKNKTSICEKFKAIDSFGHGISFLVNGNEKTQSYCGAVITLLCTILVAAYSIYQFQLMLRYSDTSVNYILKEAVFNDTEQIETPAGSLGFNIAFGIIDGDTF